jgi:putative oxidoreductase
MSASFLSQPLTATIPHVRATPFLPLAGRFSLAAIFILSGAMKFVGWEQTAACMEQQHLPMVNILLPIAATAELVGGLALLMGCMSRLASLGLILFLIPTTLIFHHFWDITGPEVANQMAHFLKNVAIMGGLLLIMAFGAGPLSFDAMWCGKHGAPTLK